MQACIHYGTPLLTDEPVRQEWAFAMSARYISYEKRGRPTREELIEVIFESYIKITNAMKQLDNIYRREFYYRNQ